MTQKSCAVGMRNAILRNYLNESLEALLNVYNYADILIEGAFCAIECQLAQMKVFSHYCLTLSANVCVFSITEIQKV